MQTFYFGPAKISVSRIGLGCMGMSHAYGSSDRRACLDTLAAALDCGINFLDTADMYGAGENERFLSPFLVENRNRIVVATKCGITAGATPQSQGRDTSAGYIRSACEASLKRLQVDVIDLYYLHRLDGVTPLEESMQALADLAKAGKIRAAGLSEVGADSVRRANRVFPVSAVQNEYSLLTRGGETEAVIDVCREIGAAFVPYSPISRGLLTGAYRDATQFAANDFRSRLPRFTSEALPQNLKLVEALSVIAKEKGATLVQIALAWVLARGPHVVPIPGTRHAARLRENAGAAAVELSPGDRRRIELAVPEDAIVGNRYPAWLDKGLG